jgi:hypothetical protein
LHVAGDGDQAPEKPTTGRPFLKIVK